MARIADGKSRFFRKGENDGRQKFPQQTVRSMAYSCQSVFDNFAAGEAHTTKKGSRIMQLPF